MARYYGTVQGAHGEASRLGTASSGISASVCSWAGRVETSIQARDDGHIVHIRARIAGNVNPTGRIFHGTFEELGQLVKWWEHRDEINAVIALLGTEKLARLTGKAVK